MKMNKQAAKNAFQQYSFILEDAQFSIMMAYFSIKHSNEVLHQAVSTHNADRKEPLYRKIMDYDFRILVQRPELQLRKDFVRDVWNYATQRNLSDFRHAISKDPYFYITTDDMKILIITEDHNFIGMLLAQNVKLKIEDLVSFKLVAVKKSHIDVDQLSWLSLVDFLALMIEEEASTDKLYNLMNMHANFVVQEETIKVFILKKKF